MIPPRRPTILLVEDNADHELLLRLALEDEGFTDIEVAREGGRALARLRQHERALPDLVLMDVKMPGLDGIETLRLMRQDERLRAVPVIMLTTSSSEEEIRVCASLGAIGFLTKPLDVRCLTTLLDATQPR